MTNLRQYRLKYRLTIQNLMDLTGLSRQGIYDLEFGRAVPSLNTAFIFEDVYRKLTGKNITIYQLFGKESYDIRDKKKVQHKS